MPRHPSEYGDLLRRLIAEHGVDCWLVNTGWTGGAYGTGRRMPIKATRALLAAALDGSLDGAEFRTDPNFGFAVPVAVSGIGADIVDPKILDPRATWADKAAYDRQAKRLVGMFIDNFAKFEAHVDAAVRGRGAAHPASPPNSHSVVVGNRPGFAPGLFFWRAPGHVCRHGRGRHHHHRRGGRSRPDDLVENFIRSSGPGGQNVNKVATAVQLRFDAANARRPVGSRARARRSRLPASAPPRTASSSSRPAASARRSRTAPTRARG